MRPLISLKLINNLQHVTQFLNPIVFAKDTNIFYSNSNINELFEIVHEELGNNFESLKVTLSKITFYEEVPFTLFCFKFFSQKSALESFHMKYIRIFRYHVKVRT